MVRLVAGYRLSWAARTSRVSASALVTSSRIRADASAVSWSAIASITATWSGREFSKTRGSAVSLRRTDQRSVEPMTLDSDRSGSFRAATRIA